jgi:hypothetical protein
MLEAGYILESGELMPYEAGAWVVTGTAGNRYPIPGKLFPQLYEPVAAPAALVEEVTELLSPPEP